MLEGEPDGPNDLAHYEDGGPNDPKVAFKGLRTQLYEVKEELSPWGWRAYTAEFKERQTAERRLRAINAMPGSGSEPKDGVVQGTPLWQERLDHLLLVEHLKKKIMIAHEKFNDASELFLASHSWLVKDYHLADTFITFITSVPESAHDRVDYLQSQLEQTRRQVINLEHEFEDFQILLQRQREEYVARLIGHQTLKIKKQMQDDVFVMWSYRVQRERNLGLRRMRESLEARVSSLELDMSEQTEELEESRRQWAEEKAALTKERDDFRKKWQKMVKAHQQAMEDLKRTEGTAEGQKAQILVLSQEKSMLTSQVEELEEHKRQMAKQLADLRDELAKIREEQRRLIAQMKDTEIVLTDTRLEVERLEGDCQNYEAKLDEAAVIEATLREEVVHWQNETEAANQRTAQARQELADEQQTRRDVEAMRDTFIARCQSLEAKLVETVDECNEKIRQVKIKAAQDLEDFKNNELRRVTEDFQQKTDTIVRRNDLLEREVAVGDAIGPHLQTLNPLTIDESKMCAICRRAIVFEGVIRN